MDAKKNIYDWHSKNLSLANTSLTDEDFSSLYLDEILSSLFVSILTGEYYFSVLKQCLIDIQFYINKIEMSNPKIIKDKKEIELMIQFYLFFIQNIENSLNKKFDVKSFNFELEYYYNKNSFIYENDKSQDLLVFWLFIVNLKISFLDEGYVVNDENTTLLWEIDHLLGILISKKLKDQADIINSTKLRCNILLYKIIRRNRKSNTDSIYFVYDNSEDLENFIKNQKGGQEIIGKINEHYSDNSKDKNEILTDIDEKINNDSIKIHEVVFFTKFFRKESRLTQGEIDKINKIIQRLNTKYKSIKKNSNNCPYLEKIHEYSCFSVLEYLLNLQFNINCIKYKKLLDQDFNFNNLEKTYKSLKEEYDKSEKIHLEMDNKIPSFIIKKTYLQNLISLLEITDNQDIEKLNDDKNDFHKLISDICKEAFSTNIEYVKSVKFWDVHRLMPLYLEIEECIDKGAFLDSSFVLPSNYQDVLNKNEANLEKLERHKILLDKVIPKNIRDNYKVVFENEVKDYKISIITIIGLYAGFITYVLGNISLLKVFLYHSIGSVLAFMLVFGVVLCFFIVSLKLLFSSFKNFKYFIVGWFIIIFVMIFTALFLIHEFKDVNISKESYKKIEYEIKK